MNLEVNQKNLYLLIPSKVSWMASILANETGISLIAAVKKIYASETYRRLEREETKEWHLGPVALYQSFLDQQE